MVRPLDFIVFGVPRSGTKGLVRALNLHPHVYCAQERFHFRANHSRLTFPNSFVGMDGVVSWKNSVKITLIKQDLAKKADVRLAGNKLPRYYLALERINREVPTLRNIWIYRSPYDFIPSWNAREQATKGQWPAGQIGLFGVLELLICIENCLALSNDIFLFPYCQGLNKSATRILQALQFITADPNLYETGRFAEMQAKREEKQHSEIRNPLNSVSLLEHEEEFLTTLQIRNLDDILETHHVSMVSDVAESLREFLASINEVLPKAIDRAFSAYSTPAVANFGRSHFNRNRTEFAGLLARAPGSEALAQFQRLAALPRLSTFFRKHTMSASRPDDL